MNSLRIQWSVGEQLKRSERSFGFNFICSSLQIPFFKLLFEYNNQNELQQSIIYLIVTVLETICNGSFTQKCVGGSSSSRFDVQGKE